LTNKQDVFHFHTAASVNSIFGELSLARKGKLLYFPSLLALFYFISIILFISRFSLFTSFHC